jgi:three-Cys-motif partner protein
MKTRRSPKLIGYFPGAFFSSLLDPYGIDIAWDVVALAGRTKSVELFINFMVMDVNMNALLLHPEEANASQVDRMDKFWGDDSWRKVTYIEQTGLFGEGRQVKLADSNAKIVEAYRERLMKVAGFQFVPRPLPFLNGQGATIYYLFFASPNRTGHDIVVDIFEKYRKLQGL